MLRATLFVIVSACALNAQVTFDRILRADKEPQNWLTYSGNTSSQRYSLLNQITPANVGNMKLQWAFQARSTERFETTPLVVDGTMYLTQAPNDILALDAATGEIKWLYSYSPSREARPCCGRVNRGVAILGNTLFMGTIDAHLVAVNARTGELVWDKAIAKPESGYAMTHAPLIVNPWPVMDAVIPPTAAWLIRFTTSPTLDAPDRSTDLVTVPLPSVMVPS